MTGEFTITLSGTDGYVSVGALVAAMENMLKILREVEESFALHEEVRWEIVRASTQSPLSITIAPKAETHQTRKTAAKVIDAMASGMRQLVTSAARPQHFDEVALDAARELVERTKRTETALMIYVPDQEPINPSDTFVENIEEIVAKSRTMYEKGTIEGQLEAISTHEKDSFFVWEMLTNHKVECIAAPHLFEEAGRYLRRRVAVSGKIRYHGPKPKVIFVETIRLLRMQHELPQPSDIGPVDITGGIASEEYVRGSRNAQ